ncbi:hypothetical protein N480_22410 [Pseudoalteromonas luteoviolacea S2607]|uniref:hypothetical protein n=1 Tax=Pseudoalteromonas luteoviolacea TaxID=43657 RepID=UPI0007B0BF6B|nr:hypothetical protein [Pseudoalteromonas luteoviolacea]KZN34359.1 hypothetical protein N480_22410 [Pseudoalteromonas luteoviolacea S2607]
MKLLFAYETDENIERNYCAIKSLTDTIELRAEKFDTILGLEYIGIKLIIRAVREGYEEFSKPQKPKYRRKVTLKNPLLGDASYQGYLTFDLLFSKESYQQLVTANDNSQIKKVLEFELLQSESVFKEMKSKLGNVDSNEFSELFKGML